MSNSKKWVFGAVAAAAAAGLAYVVYSQLSSASSSSSTTTQQQQQQQKQKQQRTSSTTEQAITSTATPTTPTPNTPSSVTTPLSSSEPTTPTNSHPTSSPQHWTSRAKQATAQKDTQAAITAWTRAIELDASGSAAVRHKYYNNRANQYLLIGRADAAQADAEESLRIQSADNAGAHYALGRSFKKQERYAEAQVQFERSIAEGAKGQILTQVERELSDVKKKVAAQPAAAPIVKPFTVLTPSTSSSPATPAPSTSSTSAVPATAPSRSAPAFVATVAPPSMRRQDTEQDLLAHEQSEDDVDHSAATHTFPTNKPPISFANIVSKAESAHQQEAERFPTIAEEHTYPAHAVRPHQSVTAASNTAASAPAAVPVPTPVVVSVQPGPGYHGSFAEVAAKASLEVDEKKAAEEEQHRKEVSEQKAKHDREQQERLERARKEEEELERKQEQAKEASKSKKVESAEERRTRERIEKTEGADAVRQRQVSGAEEQLLRAFSPSASAKSSSTSSSSFFSSQPSDELTDSGVMVDRADIDTDEEGGGEDFPSPSASRPHKTAQPQSAAAAQPAQQSAGRPIVSVTTKGASWASMAKNLATEGTGSAPVSLPSSAPSSPKHINNGSDAAQVPAVSVGQSGSTAKPAASPATSPAVGPTANSSAPPSPQLPPVADKVNKREPSESTLSSLPPPSPKQSADHTNSNNNGGSGITINGQPAKPATKPIKSLSPSMSPILSPASPSAISPVESAAKVKVETVSKSPWQPKKQSVPTNTTTNTTTTSNHNITATTNTTSLSNPASPSTSHNNTPSASPKLPPRSQPAASSSGPAPVDAATASPAKAPGGKSWAAMAAGSKK